MVVALAEIGHPQAQICHDLEGEIPMGLSVGEGAVTGFDSAVRLTR